MQPQLGPPIPREERATWRRKFISLKGLILPGMIIVAVMGTIMLGVCSATEAAAIGAVGSIICTIVHRKFSLSFLNAVSKETFILTAIIMWILFSAIAFSKAYDLIGATQLISSLLIGLPFGPLGILIAIMLIIFIMGFFLEDGSILFISLPIFLPIIRELGFNPVWFGVLFIVNLQTAYLTPPMGFALFVMKAVAPKSITMGDIYAAVLPFVGLQLIGLAIFIMFPEIILWLPNLVFGGG